MQIHDVGLKNSNVLVKQQLFLKFVQRFYGFTAVRKENGSCYKRAHKTIENLVSLDNDHIADLSLLDTINQDLKAAMLSKDVVTRDTLRMLISDIKRFEIDEKVEADDTKISNLINKNVKQRRDSIEQFKTGGREDLVATEEETTKCNNGSTY